MSTTPGFQQRLGLFDATALVAGTMIGSGIFIVSAGISRDVGSSGWLLLIWLLTGVITILGALSYAELAAMMPQAGGQYVYLREAYHPLFGFLYGWTLFLVIQCGTIAAVGIAFSKFFGVLYPVLGTEPDRGAWTLLHLTDVPLIKEWKITGGHLLAVAIIWVLTLLNCLGVREGKWVQNIFTIGKTLLLVAVIVLGLTIAASSQAIQSNTADPWSGATQTESFHDLHSWLPLGGLVVLMVAGGAMVGSLFSADSWHDVTFTAGEVRNPRRNLPLSLILGVGLVSVLYFLANVAYLAALPVLGDKNGATVFDRGISYATDDRVGTALVELVSPTWGAYAMAIGIMISTFGCVNGLILMGARAYYAMAKDGLFFRFGGQLNKRGVPAWGLVLQGVWASVLVFSGTYGQLLDYVIFAALLFYVLTVVGLFILRVKQPGLERPYRVWGYPVVPGLYVVLCGLIMLDLLIVKPVYTWPGLVIVLAGIPVYFLWRRSPR